MVKQNDQRRITMIEKLKPRKRDDGFLEPATPSDIHWKLNELVDAVNGLIYETADDSDWYDDPKHREQPAENLQELAKKAEKECRFNPVQADREVYKALTRAENVQITYITDGHTKKYYGRNGTSIITDPTLPAGYVITIKEPITKGDNNE